MKNTLFFIVLFYIPFLLSAQGKYVKINLEATEYLYPAEKAFLKKTGKPLEGSYLIKFNRYQTEKSSYIDGLKEGESRTFRNNKLTEVGFYKKDLREGEWKSYWGDGRLWKVTPYKNGLREGLEKVYSGNTLKETINYKLNRQTGLTTKFWFDGKLKSKEEFLKDKLIDTSYYHSYNEVLERICFNGVDTSFCINYNRATDVRVLDTIFYNKEKKPVALKAYKSDTLKLKVLIDYKAVIKDIIDIKVNKVEVFEDEKLKITYFFPNQNRDEFLVEEQINRLLDYDVFHYVKPERIAIKIKAPDRGSFARAIFYRQYPEWKYITRVSYNETKDSDELGGWHYYDIGR